MAETAPLYTAPAPQPAAPAPVPARNRLHRPLSLMISAAILASSAVTASA
ncbi:hypothetical protein HBA95_22990, partial [Ochrobactrum sp. MR31]|nr:hypothetical protein [Ochrobactrum sp. MR31]